MRKTCFISDQDKRSPPEAAMSTSCGTSCLRPTDTTIVLGPWCVLGRCMDMAMQQSMLKRATITASDKVSHFKGSELEEVFHSVILTATRLSDTLIDPDSRVAHVCLDRRGQIVHAVESLDQDAARGSSPWLFDCHQSVCKVSPFDRMNSEAELSRVPRRVQGPASTCGDGFMTAQKAWALHTRATQSQATMCFDVTASPGSVQMKTRLVSVTSPFALRVVTHWCMHIE
ncbi:hypothetical protein B0H21DRAFT_522693 [Amylocystis lapponica]|nr:hypothetical protein B0H21DRAFT_522693 [Amylocystis lapponica]